MVKNELLLENPNYVKWKAFANLFPYNFRSAIKNRKIPFVLNEYAKWLLIDAQRPRYFHPYGMRFFCGLPGTGKTIFMTRELAKLRAKYGRSILIGTNYGFKYQDFIVKDYNDVIKVRSKPTIIGYDEIQNDFDARNWANLDYLFSERITQSRKIEGLMILATAQKFGFVDRRLRQLTNLVYQCKTFGNRLTVAKIYEPVLIEKIEDGLYNEYNEKRSKGTSYFVQTDYLRSMYDSYQILERVKERLSVDRERQRSVIKKLDQVLSTTP